jgi:hypothetical protein
VFLIERRHYKPNTAILEIGSISRIWFDAFRAQPPKQKHRRCDRAAIAEGEANPPYPDHRRTQMSAMILILERLRHVRHGSDARYH